MQKIMTWLPPPIPAGTSLLGPTVSVGLGPDGFTIFDTVAFRLLAQSGTGQAFLQDSADADTWTDMPDGGPYSIAPLVLLKPPGLTVQRPHVRLRISAGLALTFTQPVFFALRG